MSQKSLQMPLDVQEVSESTNGRNLVLCFDGTAGQYNGFNSNVVKLFALLNKDDAREQLCYYQPGIGTYLNPSMVSPIFEWGAKILDEAVAWYLNAHVMDGYRFLMENYRYGDRICLFGWSRGAYAARALAGCLHKVGLLPRDNQEQIPFAFKLYKNDSESANKTAAGYKQTFCRSVQIEFLGAWDTVSSIGLIMGHTLPFTSSNTSIKTFRHAVSLDERRVRFLPYVCGPTTTQNAPPHTRPKSKDSPTDMLEVWFSGTHSDVGGSAVADGIPHSLSNITLRWMVRQIVAADCGIQFDIEALARAGIPLAFTPDASLEVSTDAPSADDADALEPVHDSLSGFSPWWLLEIFPLIWTLQDAQGIWHYHFGLHLGKGRPVVDPKPKFHFTVKERMDSVTLKYKPKAEWIAGTETYVE